MKISSSRTIIFNPRIKLAQARNKLIERKRNEMNLGPEKRSKEQRKNTGFCLRLSESCKCLKIQCLKIANFGDFVVALRSVETLLQKFSAKLSRTLVICGWPQAFRGLAACTRIIKPRQLKITGCPSVETLEEARRRSSG